MSASGVAPALQLSQKIDTSKAAQDAAAAEIERQRKDAEKKSKELRAALAARKTGYKAIPLADPGIVPSAKGGRTRRRFKKKRLMSRKYCKKTPCRRMGFTQKASCRPYKNCYTRRRR
jgi:hypothetical protein